MHACGFDSIPSDLGVWLTAEAARADGAELGRTHLAVRSLKGGFSGGTIDSARTQVDELRSDPAVRAGRRRPVGARGRRATAAPRQAARHPARRAGARRSGRCSSTRLDQGLTGQRDADNGHFTGPFVMAAFNTRIVARSASLLGYGEGFRYVEYSDYGAGPARCGDRRSGVDGAGRRARRARLRSDPGGARPRAAQARRGAERRGAGERAVPDGGHGGGDERRALPHDGGRALRPRATAAPRDARRRPRSPSSRTATACPMPRACSPRRRPSARRSSTGCARTASRWRRHAFPADRRGDLLGVDPQLAQHARDRVRVTREPQARRAARLVGAVHDAAGRARRARRGARRAARARPGSRSPRRRHRRLQRASRRRARPQPPSTASTAATGSTRRLRMASTMPTSCTGTRPTSTRE